MFYIVLLYRVLFVRSTFAISRSLGLSRTKNSTGWSKVPSRSSSTPWNAWQAILLPNIPGCLFKVLDTSPPFALPSLSKCFSTLCLVSMLTLGKSTLCLLYLHLPTPLASAKEVDTLSSRPGCPVPAMVPSWFGLAVAASEVAADFFCRCGPSTAIQITGQ